MANNKEMTATTAGRRTKLRAARKRVAPKHLQPPKPSAFEATLSAIDSHLDGAPVASLRMSRLPSLAKKAGLPEADLGVFVAAHKLAASTKLPPDVVFALAKRDGGIDGTKLAAADVVELRKRIGTAVKGNFVPLRTLASFDEAKLTLARLQTHGAPIRTLTKTYDLNVPDSLLRKLEAKKVETLADVRSAGGTAALAKVLNVKADDANLQNLVSHAHLSLLGTDVGSNAILIEQGYTRISEIADAPDGVFVARVGPEVGTAVALRMRRVAAAQRSFLRNGVADLLANRANGFRLQPDLPPELPADNRCSCEDCSSAVSPLAYLADLIGYATAKIGTLKSGLMPIYRLFSPTSGDHFFTQAIQERDAAAGRGYQYEGIGFYVLSASQNLTRPLYRLFRPASPLLGYVYGVPGTDKDRRTPLYRLLNDASDDHFYTSDTAERNNAISFGYRTEGGVENAGHVPVEAYDLLSAHGLEEMFLQPFNDLPTSCQLMNEQVRQVRICIEVLRAYAKANSIALPQSFRDAEAQYRRDTYEALLLKLGTSYAALRAGRGASQGDRESLATALGIPMGDGNQRDYLGELLLDIDTVTESDLERLFGLVDTTRDVLSHGAKLDDFDDTREQIKRWNFTDVSWNVNTDSDGCVFVSLAQTGGKTKVQVYRAAGTTSTDFLEAGAQSDTGKSRLALAPYYDGVRTNELAGELDIDYAAATSDIKFQVVPQFVSWRLQTLGKQWQEQDWLTDAYSLNVPEAERLPIIDPDLIGPDDFRNPFGTASTPFKKFWKKRRIWLDDLIEDLPKNILPDDDTPVPDDAFSSLFAKMDQTSYAGTNKTFWPATANDRLSTLSQTLQDKADKAEVKVATETLWTDFRLTPEMLFRLLSLKKKHEDWAYDTQRNSPLDAGEWTETINILVQAQKAAWFDTWLKDEADEDLLLGPEDFWISLREPKEGPWPAEPVGKDVPRIDPETLEFDDLPDETAGAKAIQLWNDRQEQLRSFNRDTLSAYSRDMLGATNRIKAAFPNVAIADLEQTYADLSSTNATVVRNATTYVEQTLKWSVELFKKVMELRARLRTGQTPAPAKPSDSEWVEMERLLTTAYKQYFLWKDWRKEEDDADLEYWDMLKVGLPRWRASTEARQAWQRALTERSAPAIIDPDLLRATHFSPRRVNPALDIIWQARTNKLDNETNGVFARFRTGTKSKSGLESRLADALGPFTTVTGTGTLKFGLQKLLDDAKEKAVTGARLDQLGISRAALDFFARMHGLLAQNPPQKVTEGEWDKIAASLTQVWKMRQTAVWRSEEQDKKVTLSPDWFKIPVFTSTTQFPPPKPPDPPQWRGTRSDVVDWEDRLQSRMDQEAAVIDAVRQAVSEVEELTLPGLRDALVMVCGKGSDPGARADWITQRLLIDAKQGGCEKTTRIAQAIATVQQLLWGVRTGLLADAYPSIKLIPARMKEETAIEEFDEAWTWIGSYASWRAAIFVFLYPENILLPSLKRHQTPAFRQVTEDFRGPRLSATRFALSLRRFYEYFNDVCDLTKPTCQSTISNVYVENELGSDIGAAATARRVEYLFATTSRGVLYWSVADYSDPEWGQTYWRKLPGFKNDLVSLVGCAVFNTSAQHRYLYLFAKTTKDGVDKLEFLRLDLERGGWDADASEISIDDARGQKSFKAIVRPRGETAKEEAVAPNLHITYADGSEYLYTLGQRGGTDESTAQVLGTTSNWSSRSEMAQYPGRYIWYTPSVNNWHAYTSGTSICTWSFPGTTRLFAYWAQQKHIARQNGRMGDDPNYPHGSVFSLTKRLCVTGTVSNGRIAWDGAQTLDAAEFQSGDARQAQGPYNGGVDTTRIDPNIWPIGFAVADCDHQGGPELVWCYLKKTSFDQNDTLYSVYYTIGTDLQIDGVPATPGNQEFTTPIRLPDPILGIVKNADDGTDITENGLKVAIATPPGTNRNYLVVAAATESTPRQATLYITEIKGDFTAADTVIQVAGPTSSVDGRPTGIGLAFSDLRNNGQLDAVVFYLMRPNSGEPIGEYFVNTKWSVDNPQEEWSSAQRVGENADPKKSDTWFGGLTGGAAIAVTDVNGNGRQDLVVFHDGYGNSPAPADYGVVDGFYRFGFDIGFEELPAAQTCVHDDFKPLSGAIPIESSGFRPMRLTMGDAFQRTKRSRNFVYLEEARYFFPVLVALQLQSMQEFVAALDWFRLTYDYTLPSVQRLLYGLAPDKTNASDFKRAADYDWLLDPLNPHSIAQTRSKTYLRFTQLSIIKCLLDYADTEFTTDTTESVPRARELYMTALALLYENELKPVSETCEGVRGDLEILFGDKWEYIPELLPTDLESIDHAYRLRDSLTKAFERYGDAPNLIEKARVAVTKLQPTARLQDRLGMSLGRVATEEAELEAAVISDSELVGRMEGVATQFSFMNVLRATGPSGDPYPTDDDGRFPLGPGNDRPPIIPGRRDRFEEIPFSPWNPGPGIAEPPPVVDHSVWLKVSRTFCVPQNPVLRMLRLRANLNLYKIRTCRNISGLKRELEPYAAPTDTTTGLPSIGAGGQLLLPGATTIRPTAYRYQVLIERAKQLVQLAMQIEAAYLSAIEKTDAEEYALLRAKQDLNLAKAGVRLQELRVTEAQGGIRLASLQRDRAQIQINTYDQWMSAGLSQLEEAMIGLYVVVATQQVIASGTELAIQAVQAGAMNITGSVAVLAGTAAVARSIQASAEAAIRISEIYASQERRMQEWQFEKALAEQDYAIGAQQVDLAEDHVRVTEQERTIAQMQDENAKEVVDFLTGKFTNKELYDWMSGVLERVYGHFLQQATSVAQLAQAQLAFERQETPPSYIQPDYWQGQSDAGSSSSTATTDRRGLTGSARLLQDISQLDQYAFDTNKRKLQLTKTISLAQLAPFEFQHFRERGILTFATPMEMFDRDFPGHYLRLIKRVRTSVIALIPPSQGIRATLSSTGLSRVVVGGDIFQRINLRRDPETIALSSPINATGLFELEGQQPTDMLLPMEGTGVDTQWEFRMLRSSNQFDFSTIADVLLTIEYTAINSFDYYQQVIQSPALSRPFSADRPYSFRQDFADAWYDLHNPDQSDEDKRMVVEFETKREHFPPNLSNIRIQHVMWYVASTTDNRIEMEGVELRFTEQGGGTVGGSANTNESVISTRRGNAGPWNAMIGKTPFGHWELRLPDNQTVRELFTESPPYPQRPADRVAELLLVITYSGRTQEWPV